MDVKKVTEPLEVLGMSKTASAMITISVFVALVAFNAGGGWVLFKMAVNKEVESRAAIARQDSIMNEIIMGQEIGQIQNSIILNYMSDFSSASEYAFENTIEIVREMSKPLPNQQFIERVVKDVREKTELYYPHHKIENDSTVKRVFSIGVRPMKR